ncbi:unnamed protein product [Urochloa decumbens]|uniref:PRA1 family protein n=1 Tax=Urochloa decumbens TaxID=240449 RepID=A0ABC8WHR9_9POAL
MSKYGTIPAASSTTPPAPTPEAEGSSSSTTSAPDALRPWREFADPRALSVPAGRAAARRRARANLARFAANYKLAFLAVVSLSMLWRWWPAACLSTGLACFVNLSRNKTFLFLLTLTIFELAVTGAAAASVPVTVPVGLLLVGGHAVLHRPAESADEDAAGSVV